MNEIKNVTLYACDHCGKKYQRRHHCVHHEQYMCAKNPNNQHACFSVSECGYLKREKKEESLYNYDGSESLMSFTTFICTKTGEEVHTYRMHEKRALWQFINGKRMPIECEHFKLSGFSNNPF